MKGNAKHILKGYVLGLLTVALLCSATAFAVGRTTWNDVAVGGISIVVDGKKINPTDASGSAVEPVIYNGTTYLPVRAVADALGKAVYWDGPNYTVYLGEMSGTLEYPSAMLTDMTSIAATPRTASSDQLTDNYGNKYASAIINRRDYTFGPTFEYLLNMKYSHFRGTLYVPQGTDSDDSVSLSVWADGKTIYTSPQMTKTSEPVQVDVNVTGYNDVKISFSHDETFYLGNGGTFYLCLADAAFYQ